MTSVLWIAGVSIVAALFAYGIWVYLKRSYAKYARLWGEISGIIGGTARGNKMFGTYAGMPVAARVDSITGDTSTSYFFEVVMTAPAEGKDWSVEYGGQGLLGRGPRSWYIKSKDEALKQRLETAGALAAVERQGTGDAVAYKAKHGALTFRSPVNSPYAIARPDQFTAQLALLQRLAAANREAQGVTLAAA